MSKTGETKREILDILSCRRRTLTDISKELGLSASTVCQHLVELKMLGMVQQVDNPYIKKWKYYEIMKYPIPAELNRTAPISIVQQVPTIKVNVPNGK